MIGSPKVYSYRSYVEMKYTVCARCGARVENFDANMAFICQNCQENSVEFTSDIRAYYGFFKDIKELKRSSSGGAATVLARSFILNTGGVVLGVRWREDFRGARYTAVEDINDLNFLRGSKYVDVDRTLLWNGKNETVYCVAGKYLCSGRKVLFIGLGCDCFALKAYLRRNNICDNNLYIIDLLCSGTTPRDVMEQYVAWLENKHSSKIKEFSVRYKKYGWAPIYLRAIFESGRVFTIPFYHSEFGYAFIHMKKETCYSCKFKGSHHSSDVTIGDFWGCTRKANEYNSWGMSAIVVNEEKGQTLLEFIDMNEYELKEADIELVLKDNVYFGGNISKDSKYQKYKELYEKSNIIDAMEKSMGKMKYFLIKSWMMSVKDIIDMKSK